MPCIWCRRIDRKQSVEHIIPEALGCPDDFVLKRGEVCQKCNNQLAHLDQAVIGDFDIPAFIHGVPRKRGRPPEISSRGNVFGTYRSGSPEMCFNMDPHPVTTHLGARLGAYGKSERNVNAKLERHGETAKISFGTEFGKNPKFARGLVKIAFSSLAYYLGAEKLADEAFNPIRQFVTKGSGLRPVILYDDGDLSYRNRIWSPYRSQEGYYLMAFRLVVFGVLVDLSPKCSGFPALRDAMLKEFGETGWTCLPLNAVGQEKQPISTS